MGHRAKGTAPSRQAPLHRFRLAAERRDFVVDSHTVAPAIERSKKLQAPTYKVADIMVEEKLAAVARKH